MLGPLADELRALNRAMERQDEFHFFSTSVLLLYEGAARRPADARPRAALIDFAHAFPRAVHAGGPDTNFLFGLRGIIAAIEEVLRGGAALN